MIKWNQRCKDRAQEGTEHFKAEGIATPKTEASLAFEEQKKDLL